MATDATSLPADRAARRQQPARVVAAVPVASPNGTLKAHGATDAVVARAAPHWFGASRRCAEHVESVEDPKIEQMVREAGAPRPDPASKEPPAAPSRQ